MPANENPSSSSDAQDSNSVQNGKRTLTPEQVREVARRLYEMLRRDLKIERDRPRE